MNSLREIKQKVAEENKFADWDSYAAMFPMESVDELAKVCWNQCGEIMRESMNLHGFPLLSIPHITD